MIKRIGTLALMVGLGLPVLVESQGRAFETSDFEVWAVDQSGTGGKLYIYDGESLVADPASVRPSEIDLNDAVTTLCQQQTGSAPTRGHMLAFNSSGTHAILAYVATGHVVFLDARTRAPLTCIDVGAQAHAALPAPNDRYVIVANQNGKMLHRINTDYRTNTFTLDGASTLNLATCSTPSGALCEDDGTRQTNVRPDNAPICPAFDPASRLVFITLRGGGLFVVDGTASPVRIVAEYSRSTVHGNGCGGFVAAGKMFINAGGGTAGNPTEADVYSFPLDQFPASGAAQPDRPTPRHVFSKDSGDHDSHGMTIAGNGRFVWVADRFSNDVEVIEATTDTVVNTFAVQRGSQDPAPDLLVTSPKGGYVFATLRGACPLTANTASNNAVGNMPGLAVISVDDIGLRGRLVGFAPMVNRAPAGFDCATRGDDTPGSITNQADPHGIALRLK